MKTLLPTLALFLLFQSAQAIINFGGDNSYNTTDPSTGVPWDAVARVADYDGSSVTAARGSAVYLGAGYVLTANHVNVNNNTWVTFDGTSWLQRDTSVAAQQVKANVDMKIFKLKTAPSAMAVTLYDGSSEVDTPATLVGWGVGRNLASLPGSSSVSWGPQSTIDKRWGQNVPRGLRTIPYQSGNYAAIETVLGSDTGVPVGLGDDEAAATLFDSGSGLFQNFSGTWYLSGLTTSVEVNGTSVFGDDSLIAGGHENYFVQVSEYEADIAALIPEPGSLPLIASLFALAAAFLRRGRP